MPILRAAAALLDHLVVSRGFDAVRASIEEFLAQDSSQRCLSLGIKDDIAVESVVNEFNLLQAALFAQNKLKLSCEADTANPLLKWDQKQQASIYSASGVFEGDSMHFTASLPRAASPLAATAPAAAVAASKSSSPASATQGQNPTRLGMTPDLVSPTIAPPGLHAPSLQQAVEEVPSGTRPLLDTWGSRSGQGSAAASSVSGARSMEAHSAVGPRRQVRRGTARAANGQPSGRPGRRERGRAVAGATAPHNHMRQGLQATSGDDEVLAAADLLARSAWMLG